MSTNFGGGRTLVASGAAVVLLCAGAWWLASSDPLPTGTGTEAGFDDGRIASAARREPRSTAEVRSTNGDAAATDVAQANASTPPDSEQEAVAQYAAEKYELLLEDLKDLPPDQFAKIDDALLRRELATGASGTPDAVATALAKADAEVGALLSPSQRATFDALKDSDRELFQLNEYAGGVSNVAPLGADERKSILRTKLAYKGRFRQLVADSDLSRDDLSAAEREHAYAITVSALERYRQDYLQEVRQYLNNDEQFVLLSNFETTEFAAELDKLRAKAGG